MNFYGPDENHIFQRNRGEDPFNLRDLGKDFGGDVGDRLEEDGDEDSEVPHDDEVKEERIENDVENDDTLPRPDAQVNFPARSQRGKKRGDVIEEPPVMDPIARFHWNQKNPGLDPIPPESAKSGFCSPKTNITFLKIHKTGSSTVQNIFLRYGDLHSLAFALPVMGHHLGYPSFFEKKHMLKTRDGVYNIFCHHARFSNEVREIMPPNTIYISILRDPVKVFESAFTYFKLNMRMNMNNDRDAMKVFMSNPRKYYDEFANKIHAKNGMLFDFGVPQTEYDNPSFITRAISMIDDQFDLVLIAEYFEESLIIMKDLLCWSIQDVVVFNQNSRNADSVQNIDRDMQTKIITWNSGDMLLYDHFNRSLWKKIEKYGEKRMKQDKLLLQKKTKKLFDLCVASDTASRDKGDFKIWQPPGVNINAFVLKPEAKGNRLCESMVKPEIQYTMELKIKQFPDMNFKNSNPRVRRALSLDENT